MHAFTGHGPRRRPVNLVSCRENVDDNGVHRRRNFARETRNGRTENSAVPESSDESLIFDDGVRLGYYYYFYFIFAITQSGRFVQHSLFTFATTFSRPRRLFPNPTRSALHRTTQRFPLLRTCPVHLIACFWYGSGHGDSIVSSFVGICYTKFIVFRKRQVCCRRHSIGWVYDDIQHTHKWYTAGRGSVRLMVRTFP